VFSYNPPAHECEYYESAREQEWRPRRSAGVYQLVLIDELVGKALSNPEPLEPALPLEQRFRELADKWEEETGSLSSLTKRVMHQNYQAIVGMGQQVVPILLRDLQRTKRDWFWALTAITQQNPVNRSDAGRVDKMVSAWVDWGKKRGLL